MSKYSFLDDYSEGCHPQILELMTATNMSQQTAYGDDEYCAEAKTYLHGHLGSSAASVFFIAGGTLANLIIISSALRPHEAVISAVTGHIALREAGAIEATGHKIITVPSEDGKLTVEGIEQALSENAHFPHMARPRMVYLSNATEIGTIYSRKQLTAISDCCKKNELLLLLDGARLGVALTAQNNDLSLRQIAELVDVFWIGGTKAGALLGEAVVIPNSDLAKDFAFHVKQKGALLAKGRLLGLQFAALFREDLFFALCQLSNSLAQKISTAVTDNGHVLAAKTESNQVFPVLPNSIIESLQLKYSFYVWKKVDDKQSVVRLVTSWATDEARVDAFIKDMTALSNQ